ncbi:hypothetical protein VTK26DRAFT_2238 [Humicola hyalothermophila]
MFQPEPTAYLPVSTGYAIPHGLPDYTFEETPFRWNSGRGPGVSAAGIGTSGGRAGGGSVVFGTPVFGANSADVGPAPSAPASYNNFNFHTTSSTPTAAVASNVSAPSHHRPSLPLSLKMEPDAHDIAAQEEAARQYQLQPEGPLVGKKLPSTEITAEYAKADPIYVQKTIVLPQTYSHYRPIQGDGNCGWRAIGFGYFETLIKSATKAQFEAERQRLEGLNAYIENVGGMPSIVFQDFVDETFGLLVKLAQLVDNQERAMEELMEAFNTQDISNAIMYHFRLLASAFLKGNRETYGAFVTTDSGVDGYCQTVLERHSVEIDHLGVTLLTSILLKPAGFVLEIAYLDRSPGSEVNTYRFPEEANDRHPSELGPVIHLLYRPDHYDILYPPEPEPVSLQVHRATSFSQSFEIASAPVTLNGFGAVDMQQLSLIPGFGGPSSGLAPLLDTTASPLTSYGPGPASPWVPSAFAGPIQQTPAPPMSMSTPVPPPQTHPLRFSEYCQLPEYVENDTWREPTFQTRTFRNSHFNKAHYNNPDFQPEEYKPEADEHESPPRGGSRKRGSV